MISTLELRRVLTEWQTRLRRVYAILAPERWGETDWAKFGMALVGLLQRHGTTWNADGKTYWDLRWHLQDGGELICQGEALEGSKLSVIVAQTGGFVKETDSYTWFWVEFNQQGDLIRDPYWVEGTWKEALMTLLLPYQYQAGYYLAGTAPTPPSLWLGNSGNEDQKPEQTSAEESPAGIS
ncbi:MAG: hypothetical protein PHV34_09695 [Verrucomicrobiae bacterium]|nr:hypothetical protein [Verrucomicrobiae bacterium]